MGCVFLRKTTSKMKKFPVLLFVLALFFACKQNTRKNVSVRDTVTYLAGDDLEGRGTGTEGALKAAEYIREQMEAIGLAPAGSGEGYFQEFTFKPGNDPHQEAQFNIKGDSILKGINVAGIWDNGAEKTVVIGAHYDHLGMGGRGSLHRGKAAVHNGADDNASGVALMLDLAARLADGPKTNNYLFLAFAGEEMGLLGSNYYVKNPSIDLEEVNYMINLDMVGRMRPDSTLSISGTGTSPVWEQVLRSNNPGFKLVLNESGVGPSDHTSFYLQDIPALHFFTGQHEDYHKPSDDSEKLNYKGMEMIGNYIFSLVTTATLARKLAFTKTRNESEEVPRFKVALGVIPDYLYDGKGMRIDGISEGKAAQKAMLQKGDIVVKLGDSTVKDMMSYMRALSAFEEGDTTEVWVVRQQDTLKKAVSF